jgi:pimeloyl-ACP methyl ester carboxylesterase
MRVQVGDGRLFFDVDGAKLVPDGTTMRERPTLLLLHGGPGFDHSSYKPNLSALTDSAQLIYLDHRSNGRSDRTGPERWTLPHWGDDVRDFCDALEIEKPVVMGTSFGGFVAMAYATRHPDHPGQLSCAPLASKWRPERVLEAFERIGG